MQAVRDSEELRKAVEEVQPEKVAFSLRLSQVGGRVTPRPVWAACVCWLLCQTMEQAVSMIAGSRGRCSQGGASSLLPSRAGDVLL